MWSMGVYPLVRLVLGLDLFDSDNTPSGYGRSF